MTAAATPRGRPQYAAQRDEIASSASGDRAPRSLSARQRNLIQTRNMRLNDFPLKAQREGFKGAALPRGAACPRWAGKTSFCWGLPGEKPPAKRPTGASGTRARKTHRNPGRVPAAKHFIRNFARRDVRPAAKGGRNHVLSGPLEAREPDKAPGRARQSSRQSPQSTGRART